MGIKHFFSYFKNEFIEYIVNLPKGVSFSDVNTEIDILMIDMNGIFHNSAQKIYEYGNCKPPQRLLRREKKRKYGLKDQIKLFEDVCKTLEYIFSIVNPSKKLVLCVDGTAPKSKQCIALGTRISMGNGTSCLIEDIIEGDKVWGWNGNGYTTTSNLGLQIKGEKDTIKLVLIDGSTLICTPDHRILIMSNGEPLWREAGNLQIGDNVIAGINNPLDIVGEDEKDWSIDLGDIKLNMKEFRKEILILSRLIGYILSDGYISVTEKSLNCSLILGTRIDAMLCVEEIKQLTGSRPFIYKQSGDKGTTYTVSLPQKWARRLSKLKGMPIGKRVIQPMTIPEFLLDIKCPLSVIREFIGGLFGGDGSCTSVSINRNGNGSFRPVSFSQSIIEKYKESFVQYMNQICIFLTKLGVSGGVINGPEPHTYNNGKMIPKDIEENPRVRYRINLPINNDFIEKIGFRYAHNKSLRLTIASSYWKLCKKIRQQEEEIISMASNIYDNQIIEYKCVYCKYVFSRRNSLRRHQLYRCSENTKKDMNISPSHCTLKMALKQAIDEYKINNIIIHPSSIPNIKKLSYVRSNGFTKTNRRLRNSIDVSEFLEITNTQSWFKSFSHPYEQEDIELPSYLCPIISIKQNGKVPVYDIEVTDNHSFLANGVCVHNCQQRQRRFRSAKEMDDRGFDSNSITPGTKFMDYMSKYIDWYIRKRISEDEKWQNIDIVFSNEKAPGEGESKAINFIRKFGNRNDTYCMFGLDADLIMLTLGTHMPKFYLLREDLYDASNEFYLINIGEARSHLSEIMTWKSERYEFNPEWAINDFVFLCFMVGNDFLPHIPSIEILEDGITIILSVCKDVGRYYGHITRKEDEKIIFNPESLKVFLGAISEYEKEILEAKLEKKESFFPDEILERCSTLKDGKYNLDIERYRAEYCFAHFPRHKGIDEICHDYFKGLQWVLTYYTNGVPDWTWNYPYHYAPSAAILTEHIDTFIFPTYKITFPIPPFQQLLSVLPPKSANLIPKPLNRILTDSNSPLKKFCPNEITIDYSGKRKEWEGIVILPMIDSKVLRKIYFEYIDQVEEIDLRRNIAGKTFVYNYSNSSRVHFRSYYGDIQECKVRINSIEL